MNQPESRLPIRLLPRKRGQIPKLPFSGFFLGFAIFWTAMAAGMTGRADFDDAQGPELWLSRKFPLFGVPFMLVGAVGIARAVLKMLPGSPYYHLEIGAEGLLLRSLFRQQRFAWRDLPPFDTLERRRNTKNGVRIEHYTVAMQSAAPEPGAKSGATDQREVLRIFADEYGANNGAQDAAELATWLNRLRELALDRRLTAGEQVEVPEGFRASAMSVSSSPHAIAQRSATVVRR